MSTTRTPTSSLAPASRRTRRSSRSWGASRACASPARQGRSNQHGGRPVAMNSRQALEIFARYRDDAPVMVSSGGSGTILSQLGHRTPTMYNTGMSYTSPACLGLALARPDLKVVAVEGDGAMLMGLANLATIGRYLPRNLVILVINNRTYLTTDRGELETACRGRADL